MGNSFNKVYVHLIFHTRSSGVQIKEEHLPRVFQYMGGIIRSMSGYAIMIGGRPDHIHILTTVPATMSLADMMRDIKSNTTKWLKGIDADYGGFSWQEGYGAFSVSESRKNAVIDYISNQEAHHRINSAQDEFCHFLKNHGVSIEEMNHWKNSCIVGKIKD